MPQKPPYDLSEFGGTPIAPGTPPDTTQDASAIPPPALIKTADAPRVSGYDLSEFGGQPIKEPKSGYDLSQFGGVPISSGSLVGMATAKASQSWLGDTWDWLWTGRYNDVMDKLGAPDWMHYTGAAAKSLQESIGGKMGAIAGGLVGGAEEALYSQSSVAGMLLLAGTLGGSTAFEGAGEAAIVGTARAGEAIEAGVAGAEAAEGRQALKGAGAIAKMFTKEDFSEVQKGVEVVKKAEALGQNVEAALTEANINPKMLQDALNVLHRTGLGPMDVMNRGLIVNGGGQLLRTLGMGIGEADKLAKTGQILLDAGFSANMLLGVGYNFPRIWEAAKTGNTEEAFRLASESSVFGLMGFMGLGAAKQHAGEVYGDILQKYGFNVKMDQARIAMRDIGNMRGRMETEGVVYAKNLDAEISKKFKAAGLDEGALHSAKILAEGNLEAAKVRERYNLLCENAGHPELKVLVPPEEAQQAGPAEYYMQQGDSVHIPPQQYFQRAFNVSTVEDAAAAVVRTPEDRAKVDELKKRFMAGKPGVSAAILYDEKGNVIGAENPHQALAYLELEKNHPGLQMPVASKFRSDQNPIHTSVEEDRMAKYASVAAQQLLTRAEAYSKDGALKLLANYRNAIEPTPAVRELAQWTRTEFLKALEYAHSNGVSIPAIEAYTTNMWEDTAKQNAAHEAFKHDLVHDSKLRLNATMLHKRTFANAFEGEMEGKKLKITDPVKLVANYWATISKLAANRWALKKMKADYIRTSVGMPAFVVSGTGSVETGPNGENPIACIDASKIHDPDIAGKELSELFKNGHLDRMIQEDMIRRIEDTNREGPKKPMFANPPIAQTIKAHIDKQLKEGTPVGATYNIALARMGKDPDMASSGTWAVSIYPEHTQVLDHNPTAAEIDAFAKNPVNQRLLFDVRNNLGIWRSDDGRYHMDISFLTKDFELARSAGQTYNQEGIVQLDGKNFPFVSTGGDGTVPKTLPPGWESENERTNALYLRHEVSVPEVHDSVKRNLSNEVATAKGPQQLFQRAFQPVEPEKPVNIAPPDPKLPILNAAAIAGGDVSTPATSYRDIEFGRGNGWVRRSAEPENSAAPTNKDRTLMMQFNSDLINRDMGIPGAVEKLASNYFDKLYSGRTGYDRLHDFWEIPQWMGFASHFLPDADVYVVRDMAEAKAFLKKAGYDRVLFSSMDTTKNLITELARDNPGQHFDVGGYALPTEFKGHDNIKWHDSMRALAADMKIPYKKGVDYRHFEGSDVIPRLTMSQGCSHLCAFCTVPKKVEAASPMLVRQQLDAIAKLKPKLIYLNDKTFGQAPNYRDLADLNTKMRELNPDFKGFVVQTTAAQMAKFGKDPEWLHKSGIKFVELGIETYNDAILKDLHKPQSYARFVEPAIAALAKEKIALIPNIIIGLPGETSETYQNTLNFLKRPDVQAITSHVNVTNLALYPDAELGKKMTTASPEGLDQNVTAKSYHGTGLYAPAEVHTTFAGDLYNVGIKLVGKTPEALAVPDGDVSSMHGLDDQGRMKPEFNALDYLTKRGAELIATGVSDFKTFASAIQNDVGETTIDPQHLQDLFRKANDYLTDTRGRTTQGRAEGTPPPFVSPEEWGSLNERGQLAYKVFMENQPSDAEYRAAAIVGQGGKDWYRRYTAGFQVLFPDPKDYNTFTRLFAALSPRKSVHTDLAQTLNVWAAWKEAGSPTDTPSLTQLAQDNGVMGIQAEPGVKYKPAPNFIRALTSEEELHGPKVSAFNANLQGNFWRATLDTWLQLFSGQKPEGFKPVGTAGHEQYLAVQAKVRSVAHELGWTPEQAQASIWTFVKTLVDIANPKWGTPKVSFKEVLGLLTPEEFTARSKDLIDLVANDKEIQNALTRIGIGSSVIESAKRAAADVSKTTPGAGQTQVPPARTLASVADRLQEHRSELERNRLMHQEPPPLLGGRMVVPDDIAAGKKGTPQDGWITPAGQVRPRGTPGAKHDIDLDTGAIYYARGAKKSLGLQVQNLDLQTRDIIHSALLQMDTGRITLYVHGTETRMDFPTKADALLRMSGEDTGHSQAYTLGRIDDGMKERTRSANDRLFQKTEIPGTGLDLATAGAKFLWDQPTTFNEWKELMRGAYGKKLETIGGDPNVVLQDLYEQSLHRALDIVKERGIQPVMGQPTPLVGTHAQIGESPEAIARVQSEKLRAVKRYRIDTRSGNEIPILNTVDAVDVQPGPYERIIMRYSDGHDETIAQGIKARGIPPKPILTQKGERPKLEPFEGYHLAAKPIEGTVLEGARRGTSGIGEERKGFGTAPGVYVNRIETSPEPALEGRQYRYSVNKPQALAAIDNNPVANLARELAVVEHATPGETRDRIEKALKDAGYTGYYHSQDQGRVFVLGDLPVTVPEPRPLSETFEQDLQDKWGYTKTQASASTAILKGWAAMAGQSYEDFVNSRFAGVEELKAGMEKEGALKQGGTPKPWYFSALTKAAQDRLPELGSGEQMLNTLRNTPGVKQAELAWTGLDDFLKDYAGQKITKQAVLDWLHNTQVQVNDVTHKTEPLGAQPDVKFAKWVMDGPTQNYRELLLTFDPKMHGRLESYRSPHWGESNVLAHLRTTDRIDADGKKTLFIEEAQSDWGQAIKKTKEGVEKPVPAPMPFVGNWHELVMKRALRMAAEEGYDRVAWTTGSQQAERYNLSRDVNKIIYHPDTKRLFAYSKSGDQVFSKIGVSENELASYIGQEPAKRLSLSPVSKDAVFGAKEKVITGEDLKLGGQWAKHLYDQMLPEFMNKYTKKWGGKVGETEIAAKSAPKLRYSIIDPNGEIYDAFATQETAQRYVDGLNADASKYRMGTYKVQDQAALNQTYEKVHSIDVTPAMKQAVLETGQALFQKGDEAVRGMVTFGQDGKAIMYALKKGDFSTFVHEAGHVMRRGLSAGDQEILERTLGVKSGKWEVPHEEEFAQSLEQYMLEGEAPNKAMAGIFEKCKMWMRQVYLSLVGRPEVMKDVHPELRDIFDRMFGKDAENAEALEPTTTQKERLQKAVADGGGQWVGVQEVPNQPKENLALFNIADGPAKGTTVSVPTSEATPERVKQLIAERQEAYHAGLKRGPSVLYQEAQNEPTVEDLQKEPKDKPRYVWNSHMYKTVPDSAFRNWNWAAYTPDGTKVMVNGELRVHPEMYDYVTRMFGLDESSLRKSSILGPILKVGSIAKQTLLSLSPFHIPQIGLRAIMSGVLPRIIKWDLKTDPQLARLVENSLELGQHYNVWEENQYQEGLMAGGNKGLVSLVPGVRDYQTWLQKFTFERLLPSLKVLVAKKMDDRYAKLFNNQSFYEKFITEHKDFAGLDKVRASARAAAIETNERLGMLNYKDMGRAAGTQDFLRLVTLAPDWLESEVRMVKRMFDPTGGKLLRRDMTYMVAGMWMTARVLNLLYTGQAHNEAPFGVAVQGDDGKEKIYSIRTLPTDMLHMAEDPDGFFKGRASPQVRALAEVVHGRDAFGRQLTPWQQTMDLTRNIMPIPLQAVEKIATGEMPQLTSTEQVMKSTGLTVVPFRDEAQKLATKLVSSRSEQGPVDPVDLRKHQLMLDFEQQLRDGKIRPEDIYQMTEDGQISVQEAKRIIRTAHDTTGMEPELGRLYTQVSRLNMKDFLQVWAVMNDQEKAATAVLLTKKKVLYLKQAMKSMTPTERKADPIYSWIRTTFPLQAPWGEE